MREGEGIQGIICVRVKKGPKEGGRNVLGSVAQLMKAEPGAEGVIILFIIIYTI